VVREARPSQDTTRRGWTERTSSKDRERAAGDGQWRHQLEPRRIDGVERDGGSRRGHSASRTRVSEV
jgi:hypothetical protein